MPTYESQLTSTRVPVVDQEWVSQCVLNDRLLQPERYSILPGQQGLFDRDNFKVPLDALESLMEKVESSDKMMTYLRNCVIYISKMDENQEQVQQRLIQIGGGAHIMTIIPNITHIVVDTYHEDQVKEFNKFSNVYIVGSKWLKDCMRYKTRVPEVEYVIKPTKKAENFDGYLIFI